jgi:hypothetical protein
VKKYFISSFAGLCLFSQILALGCTKATNDTQSFMEPGFPPGQSTKVAPLNDQQKQDFSALMQDAGRVEAASQYVSRRFNDSLVAVDPTSKILALANRMQVTGCLVAPFYSVDPADQQISNIGVSIDGANCLASAKIFITSSHTGSIVSLALTHQTSTKPGPDQSLNDVFEQAIAGTGTITESGSLGNTLREAHFRATGHISSASRGSVSVIRTLEAKQSVTNNVTKARIEIADFFTYGDHKILLQQIAIQDGAQSSGRHYYLNGIQISDVEYASYLSAWSVYAQIANKF